MYVFLSLGILGMKLQDHRITSVIASLVSLAGIPSVLSSTGEGSLSTFLPTQDLLFEQAKLHVFMVTIDYMLRVNFAKRLICINRNKK